MASHAETGVEESSGSVSWGLFEIMIPEVDKTTITGWVLTYYYIEKNIKILLKIHSAISTEACVEIF